MKRSFGNLKKRWVDAVGDSCEEFFEVRIGKNGYGQITMKTTFEGGESLISKCNTIE